MYANEDDVFVSANCVASLNIGTDYTRINESFHVIFEIFLNYLSVIQELI